MNDYKVHGVTTSHPQGIPYEGPLDGGKNPTITIASYGGTLGEAQARHHAMSNPETMLGEARAERIGGRWRITWQERAIPKIKMGQWFTNQAQGGSDNAGK